MPKRTKDNPKYAPSWLQFGAAAIAALATAAMLFRAPDAQLPTVAANDSSADTTGVVKAPLHATGNVVFEGQAADAPMSFCMGVYRPTIHVSGGRGVWQKEGGADLADLFLYWTVVGGAGAPTSGLGTWLVSDGENMRAGAANGGWCAGSEALAPYLVDADRWRVWDGDGWTKPAAPVRARLLPETARQQQRAAALAAARDVGAVEIVGQPAGARHADCMGLYDPIVGTAAEVVGGRGVWRQRLQGSEASPHAYYLFYADSIGEWFVGGEASMRAGHAAGKWSVRSAAMTPDLIAERFQIAEGTTWVDAPPEVRVRAVAM